jgi:hypothetical protein
MSGLWIPLVIAIVAGVVLVYDLVAEWRDHRAAKRSRTSKPSTSETPNPTE